MAGLSRISAVKYMIDQTMIWREDVRSHPAKSTRRCTHIEKTHLLYTPALGLSQACSMRCRCRC